MKYKMFSIGLLLCSLFSLSLYGGNGVSGFAEGGTDESDQGSGSESESNEGRQGGRGQNPSTPSASTDDESDRDTLPPFI